MPARQRVQALSSAQVLRLLAEGEITLVGRLLEASNHAFLAMVTSETSSITAIYKPVAGERPLWDFPDGTLAGREVAAFLVSEAGGGRSSRRPYSGRGRMAPVHSSVGWATPTSRRSTSSTWSRPMPSPRAGCRY